MELFRLSKQPYAYTLSGKGAALKGARWNSVGVELIYTAINRSLAMAEVAVHFSLATLPTGYMVVTIDMPDDLAILQLAVTDLPIDWNTFPHPSFTQAIGDRFVADNIYCALQIPSAVTQGDYNLLINPNHIQFKKIKILNVINFPFDKRIFR